MPMMRGFEVTRWILSKRFSVGILILTAYYDEPYVLVRVERDAGKANPSPEYLRNIRREIMILDSCFALLKT